MITYTVTGSDSHGKQAIIVIDGHVSTVSEDHPFFEDIIERLYRGQLDGIEHLIDAAEEITHSLNENVSITGEVLFYKGEPMYSRLSDTVLEFYRSGRNFKPLLNFMERLFQNPSRHSRTQLFEFLSHHDFTITEDGCFLAYKGIDPSFYSISSGGEAFVNGEKTQGRLHNAPGNTLEMSRGEVMDDPSVACSFGLHAGTWEYARGFGPVVVEVKVDPADVVSVPNDCGFQKLRTSRYVVMRQVKEALIPENRYDATSDFQQYLMSVIQNYSRKGRLASTYVSLADDYLEFREAMELPSSDGYIDALMSYAEELDMNHTARSVYRYHVEELLYTDEEDDEEDEEDEEDDLYYNDGEEHFYDY